MTSQRILRSNIAEWEKQTCVKFEEVLREPNEQYLWFINRKGHGYVTNYVDAKWSKPPVLSAFINE